MACLRALYAHEGEDAAAVAAAVEATRSRIEGFGSDDCWSSLPPTGGGRPAAGVQQQQYYPYVGNGKTEGHHSGKDFCSPSMSYLSNNISNRHSNSPATMWGPATGGGIRPAMPGFGNPAFARQNAAAAATPGEQALYLISSTASKIIPAGMHQQLQRVVSAALPVAGLQPHPGLSKSGPRGASHGSTTHRRGAWQSDRSNIHPECFNSSTGGYYRAPPRPGASSSSTTTASSDGSIRTTHGGDVFSGSLNEGDKYKSPLGGTSISPRKGMNSPVSQGLPPGQYEERIVDSFLIPCGATLLPSRAVLRDFCCRCQSFDAPVLGNVIVQKLSDTSLSLASRLRLLAGCEALLKQEEMSLQQLQQAEGEDSTTEAAVTTLKTYLLEHAKDQLIGCLDTPQLRIAATQVLLLIGESCVAAAAAEDNQKNRKITGGGGGKVGDGFSLGLSQTAKHVAAREKSSSAVTTPDTPNLLDIAGGGEDTAAQQQYDLLDTDAATAVPTGSDSDGLLLLIGDSSSNKSGSFSCNVSDNSLHVTALNAVAPSMHTTTSLNSLSHADDVNIVLANELQRHTPFAPVPSFFSSSETTSAAGNRRHATPTATSNSSSGGAPPALAQSSPPLLAQLKKRETRTQGSVFSGLTVKRPAGDAASALAAVTSAASSSAASPSAACTSVDATFAGAAAPGIGTADPLDLLSTAAGLADAKQQQKQQQHQHTSLSSFACEAAAVEKERSLLDSTATPHTNAVTATVDMLSLDQALYGDVHSLRVNAGSAATSAGGASAIGTSYLSSSTFTAQAPAFASTVNALQHQQQQLRSVDTTSRTAHLDRFFGRFPGSAGVGAVPPQVSGVEQQQITLVQTVQQQQAVIQKLQEQQQQMLLLLQEKQGEQKKGTFAEGLAAVDAVHLPSPQLHSPTASAGTDGREGTRGVTATAAQSSLLLSMTKRGSSLSSPVADTARAAGVAHTTNDSTVEQAVATTAQTTPRPSKFAFVKS